MDKTASDSVPRVQSAVYVASDATGAMLKPVSAPDIASDQKSPQESKPMRIFWFLGGR